MLGSQCRAIRYKRHNWPIIADRETFVTISSLDTMCCESLHSNTIRCDLVTMRHVSIHAPVTCLGQTCKCAVRERPARRAAAPPLLLFLFFPPTRPCFRGGARGVASGRKRVECALRKER